MARDILTIPVQIGGALPDIAVKQGDCQSRVLHLLFTDRAGSPIDLTDHLLTLFTVKPDLSREFITGSITDPQNGEAELVLTANVLSVAGMCECELTLTGPNSIILSSNSMHIAVIPLLRDQKWLESTDEYPALLDALKKAEEFGAQIFTMSINGGPLHYPDESGNVDLLVADAADLEGYVTYDSLDTKGSAPKIQDDGTVLHAVIPDLPEYVKKADIGAFIDGDYYLPSTETISLPAGGDCLTDEAITGAEIQTLSYARTERSIEAGTLFHAAPSLSVNDTLFPLPELGEWDYVEDGVLHRMTSPVLSLSDLDGEWYLHDDCTMPPHGVCVGLETPLDNIWLPDGAVLGSYTNQRYQMRILCSHFPSCTAEEVLGFTGRRSGIGLDYIGRIIIRIPYQTLGVTEDSQITPELIKSVLTEMNITIAYGYGEGTVSEYHPNPLPIKEFSVNRISVNNAPSTREDGAAGITLSASFQRAAPAEIKLLKREMAQSCNKLPVTVSSNPAAVSDLTETHQLSAITIRGNSAKNSTDNFLHSTGEDGDLVLHFGETDIPINAVLRSIPNGDDTVQDELVVDYDKKIAYIYRKTAYVSLGKNTLLTMDETYALSVYTSFVLCPDAYPFVAPFSVLYCNQYPYYSNGFDQEKECSWTSDVVAVKPLLSDLGAKIGDSCDTASKKALEWFESENPDNTIMIIYERKNPVIEWLEEETTQRLLALSPNASAQTVSATSAYPPDLSVTYRRDAGTVVAELVKQLES